jgi:hypothetical protein
MLEVLSTRSDEPFGVLLLPLPLLPLPVLLVVPRSPVCKLPPETAFETGVGAAVSLRGVGAGAGAGAGAEVGVSSALGGGATVITVAADGALLLPAKSVTLIVRVCAPTFKLVGIVQSPCGLARVVPISTPPSNNVTVALGSVTRPRKGLLELGLFSVPTLSGAAGVLGAVLSIVKLMTLDFGLVLPAGSVAVAVNWCVPSSNGELVMLHVPLVPTWIVPTTLPVVLSISLIKLPGSAVRVTVGVFTLVRPSVLEMPLSLAGVRVTLPGVAGGLVSTVIDNWPAVLGLPAASWNTPAPACITAAPSTLLAGVNSAL